MHPFTKTLLAMVLLGAGWVAGCARCGDDPGLSEQPGSQPLAFERIELGASPAQFRAAVAELAGIGADDATRLISCGDQTALMVIDPGEETAEERLAGGHRLTNCALLQAAAVGRSWDVAAVRGEFVDDALASVTVSFAATAHQRLAAQLTERFGEPAAATIEERSLLGEEEREHLLWRVRDELWALSQGRQNTLLVHQGLTRCQALPPLPEPKRRPAPVNLDDLGLGGGLDLKAPLPTIDAGLLTGGDH
jgi:hypothetical protein